jgi:DUF1009 family protein
MTPIGLLAGYGRFPFAFAEKARQLGIPVVCVGIRGEASAELGQWVDRFYWSRIAGLGRMIRCFKREGVRQVVMAGKIHKTAMYTPWRLFHYLPDWRAIRAWYWTRRPDNRDDTLLLGIIREFETDGIHFESALDICPELLAPPGVLTRRPPSEAERRDIALGWALAKEMGRLDIGQSVVLQAGVALAVEAIEGTDQAIRRAGGLAQPGGFTVVKVAKPQQDMRFDVPTIGPSTIETIHQSGGKVLAIEADKTIVLDEAETLTLANRHDLTVVALKPGDTLLISVI